MTEKIKETKAFNKFVAEIKDMLEPSATEKGYNSLGTEKNELYQFVQGLSHSDSHAIGEIIYKCVRYTNKGDKRDLLKIAAWAYLIWRFGH